MGNFISCIETVRIGSENNGEYYILDAKQRESGPLARYSPADYAARLALVLETGDAHALFDANVPREQFTDSERDAYLAYAAAGRLTDLANGQVVTAFEDMRDLHGQGDLR